MSRLISIRRAAREVRVRPAKISGWVAAGKLPGYRDGKRTIRVDLDDVVALIKSHRIVTNTVLADSEHAHRVVGAVLEREARK